MDPKTSRGLGNVSSFASLLKSDPQAAPAPTMIPDEIVSDAGNGATEGAATLEKSARKKRVKVVARLEKRGLHLSQDVMTRLTFLAHERKQSLSQVANAILDGNLPKYTLTRVAG